MRLGTLRGFGRRASVAPIAALIALTAACSSQSPGESPPEEAATTAVEEVSSEAAPEYCADLAGFDDAVKALMESAIVGGITVEEVDPDTLAAEADRLAQSALELSTVVPPAIADALAVLSEALLEVQEGILAGERPHSVASAAFDMSDKATYDAFEVIRTDLHSGGCAGFL